MKPTVRWRFHNEWAAWHVKPGLELSPYCVFTRKFLADGGDPHPDILWLLCAMVTYQ